MTFTPPQMAPEVLDRLAPWLTPAADPAGDHATFLTAAAAMGQGLWGLVMDSGDDPDDPSWVPGWGSLTDVDICPTQYLPFLAQLVGVVIPAGTDDATARSLIRSEQGMQRGTPASIIAAAKRFLTGSQHILLFERTAADGVTPDPYHFLLVVRTSEVTDAAGLTAAVEAVKPAGLQWTLIQSDGYTWDEAIHIWNDDTQSWNQTATIAP